MHGVRQIDPKRAESIMNIFELLSAGVVSCCIFCNCELERLMCKWGVTDARMLAVI